MVLSRRVVSAFGIGSLGFLSLSLLGLAEAVPLDGNP